MEKLTVKLCTIVICTCPVHPPHQLSQLIRPFKIDCVFRVDSLLLLHGGSSDLSLGMDSKRYLRNGRILRTLRIRCKF